MLLNDQDGDWLSRGGSKYRRRGPERAYPSASSNDDEPKDF